jgi:hypothetical protein
MYGSGDHAVDGATMLRRIGRARNLPAAELDRCVTIAGAHEKPRLEHVDDLRTARPAVTYHACRLAAGAPGQMAML